MKKTKILGIVVLLVALVAMLSSAVFAANVVKVEGVAEAKVGAEVKVTVKYPMPVDGGEYFLTFNPDVLKYEGDYREVTPGKVKVAFMDNDFNTKQSDTFTFKAVGEGTSTVSLEGIELTANQGITVADVTVAGKDVTVVGESAVVTPPTDEGEEGNSGTGDAVVEGAESGNAGDETITSLKDAKTGFDVMAVVLPMMAIIAVVGVCKFAKRK